MSVKYPNQILLSFDPNISVIIILATNREPYVKNAMPNITSLSLNYSHASSLPMTSKNPIFLPFYPVGYFYNTKSRIIKTSIRPLLYQRQTFDNFIRICRLHSWFSSFLRAGIRSFQCLLNCNLQQTNSAAYYKVVTRLISKPGCKEAYNAKRH